MFIENFGTGNAQLEMIPAFRIPDMLPSESEDAEERIAIQILCPDLGEPRLVGADTP